MKFTHFKAVLKAINSTCTDTFSFSILDFHIKLNNCEDKKKLYREFGYFIQLKNFKEQNAQIIILDKTNPLSLLIT